jgi:signal transduction histidine kinase
MLSKRLNKLKDSLIYRLTILYAVTFTLFSAVGFAIFYYRIYSIAVARLDSEMLKDNQSHMEIYEKYGLESFWENIEEDVKQEDIKKEFYRIINSNSDVLFSTDMSAWGNLNSYGIAPKVKNKEVEHISETIQIQKRHSNVRVITLRLSPSLFVQIGESMEEVDEYLKIFRVLLAVVVGILIIFSTIIGWFLARSALLDMLEVTKTANDIIKGKYNRRVKISGRFKETKRLGKTFNTMLDKIQQLLLSLQQINNNIAHDLRSPLTRIRGIAEMTLVKNNSVDSYREMAINTIEECDTLIDIINTMLDITEVESGINTLKSEDFDLSILVEKACELFKTMAIEKNIKLHTHLPKTVFIKGDERRMQRIVTNLLENAIKYTPKRGDVTVKVDIIDSFARIAFKDTGIGISKKDLPEIFNRFYRCDQSRSQSGVGLGLSLVKAYTKSMQGKVYVQSKLNKGSLFVLQIPLSQNTTHSIHQPL